LWDALVYLVFLVCLVYLVDLVGDVRNRNKNREDEETLKNSQKGTASLALLWSLRGYFAYDLEEVGNPLFPGERLTSK